MVNVFNNLSEKQQGAILIAGGSVLLFHALGFIKPWFSILVVVASLYMVYCGFCKVGGQDFLKRLFKKSN